MELVKLICGTEIPVQHQKFDSCETSFPRSLNSFKAQAKDSVQNQAKVEKLKANLRQEEDELVSVLVAKTHKEAKLMVVRDSVSDTKARIEELMKTISIQRARRDGYASTVSRQSAVLATFEEKEKGDMEQKEEILEAISWYNKVLGFQVEGGHGVKFTFHNIDKHNPDESYPFTLHHVNDNYRLLDCEPQVDGTKELIFELNQTNGLFKFVSIMREKFQEAAAQGSMPQSKSLFQGSISIIVSAPALSISSERSESPANENCPQFQLGAMNKQIKDVKNINESPESMKENNAMAINRHLMKVNRRSGTKSPRLSPASALRRSPLFKRKSFAKCPEYVKQ